MHEVLESRSTVPFTRAGRMDASQYRSLVRGAQQELTATGFKLYYKV